MDATALLQLVLGIITALPQAAADVSAVYNNLKSALSATTQAQIDAALAAANSQLDADMAQLDADAAAHGG